MFYVYIIKSTKNGQLYLGSTGDLRRRLAEHNSGFSTYTKKYMPYTLSTMKHIEAEKMLENANQT